MGTFRFLFLWLLFAATYVGFFIPIFRFFPEVWLHNLFIKHTQLLTEVGAWEAISMLMIELSALVVNLIFIFFSLTIMQRLRKSVTRGFQHHNSIQISAFKFSSLWLLFAITYFVFYALIFFFYPEIWLYNLFLEAGQDFIEQGTWNIISISILLLSVLVVNLIFIFLSLTLIQRLRNRKKK